MDIESFLEKTTLVRALLDGPPKDVAVAVSGGPDSMALLFLLSRVLSPLGVNIHALTFDHGLRPDSMAEAAQVGAWVSSWPGVHHHVLTWDGDKPDSSVMEQAREARYTALCAWCAGRGIDALWLAHHRTDQAETFLFRLAKGSGLDGLCGMADYQPCAVDARIHLARPLLSCSKDDILAFCEAMGVPYVRDPSNENMKYARARLRHALPVLAQEGLSEQRLAVTAKRLERARIALDYYAGAMIADHARIELGRAQIARDILDRAPEEIRIRVVRQLLERAGAAGYGPRLDRLEQLLDDFFNKAGKPFTLGGYRFFVGRDGVFTLTREEQGVD